ncbi:Nif3-like dinuclear metal center hexameric protein [Clostridium sp. AM58-1XD]|uniref:Nif3-like dinuclear metal center hexameric protein n=1 Tax=Clostridium sp. AM58-1XD TaxID=2292307 RepID=UPI000E52B813|nr:Nif3-like dinuclear metal center hexameric protein [Clostridium sp. AM58-1XD]RGZ00633.1 Nif3-like dinuclear metal center hexameric protein [Clostridium sp. AM58-1XD]
MKCSEIITILEELAPVSCACEWDNPGLLAGRSDKEVKKILVALDATDEVVEKAAEEKVDLLLTHHPLLFRPVKKINDQDFITRRILKLIRNDISYYAMHTNFDSAPGCMADLAAGLLGMKETQPLEEMGLMRTADGEVPYGIGKFGLLPEKMTVREAAEYVKEKFGLNFVTVYGLDEGKGKAEKIAVCPGSGGSEIEVSLAKGAEILVTGDISHHQGIDAAARNMAVIDAGHYGLEYIFIGFMAGYLKEHLKDEAEVTEMPVHFPVSFA